MPHSLLSPPPVETTDGDAPPRCRVLVVDEIMPDRDLYCIILEGMGMQVLTAADGWQGLVCARTIIPDLVITDLSLPGLDGARLAARIRADPRTAAVPILMVTGNATDLTPLSLRACGVTALLPKPLDLAVFQETLEMMLASSRSRPATASAAIPA